MVVFSLYSKLRFCKQYGTVYQQNVFTYSTTFNLNSFVVPSTHMVCRRRYAIYSYFTVDSVANVTVSKADDLYSFTSSHCDHNGASSTNYIFLQINFVSDLSNATLRNLLLTITILDIPMILVRCITKWLIHAYPGG